ncbi:MAG: hypothetical protein WC413_01565 [Candidatus Nanoarchaeia archaeon]
MKKIKVVNFSLGKNKVSIERLTKLFSENLVIKVNNKQIIKEPTHRTGTKKFNFEAGEDKVMIDIVLPYFPAKNQYECKVWVNGKIKDIYYL